jgi:hypothetical protein
LGDSSRDVVLRALLTDAIAARLNDGFSATRAAAQTRTGLEVLKVG